MRSEGCVATLNRHFQKRTLSGNKVRGRPGRSSSSPSSESTLEGPRRPEKLGKAHPDKPSQGHTHPSCTQTGRVQGTLNSPQRAELLGRRLPVLPGPPALGPRPPLHARDVRMYRVTIQYSPC